MAKKLGLALGSGAAKGIAHAGVLQALEDNGIKVDFVAGCSAGSVVGACYAIGMKPKKIFTECKKLTKSAIVDVSLNVVKNRSVFKSAKMKALLEKYLGDAMIEDLKIPFSCIATDLNTGKLYEFTSGSVVTAVKASCAIPIFFSPVEKDDMLLVDGGVITRTPVKAVKNLGADVVIAVDVNADVNYDEKVKGLFGIAVRAMDIMDHSANRATQKGKPDLLIKPDLKCVDQFKVEKQDYIYKQGYNAVIEQIDKIKALISD